MSCLPISEHIFEIQTVFAGFHVPVWLSILEQTAQNSKTPKGNSTSAAVGGLQTGFAAGQGQGR